MLNYRSISRAFAYSLYCLKTCWPLVSLRSNFYSEEHPFTHKTMALNVQRFERTAIKNYKLQKKTHPFFIAVYSEIPAVLALLFLPNIYLLVNYFHGKDSTGLFEIFFILLLFTVHWVIELEKLGTSLILFNRVVQKNQSLGIVLFIVSEVMIFFALFWAYFHSSLSPSDAIGGIWPPKGLEVLSFTRWPALATGLLIYSGFCVNTAQSALKALARLNGGKFISSNLQARLFSFNPVITEFQLSDWFFNFTFYKKNRSIETLVITLKRCYLLQSIYAGLIYSLVAGLIFVWCQTHEYKHATFSMDDGIYGSVFYSLTGLHGLHVIAGLTFIFYALLKLNFEAFNRNPGSHLSFNAAVWYWHFVDIVWIFLFIIVYIWGNATSAEEGFLKLFF